MRNMKIEINEAQSLDEVVRELERLGYGVELKTSKNPKSICTYDDGTYHIYMRETKHKIGDLTTLAELKEMQCKI